MPVRLEARLLAGVQQSLAHEYDRQYGGFGFNAENPQRPKFPEPPNLEFLLDRAARRTDAAAREMVLATLDKMAEGGIRDHVGGGFHRYSTDRYWRVPHFEKMLYDNAQLVSVYARAYELEAREPYRQVVDETLSFLGASWPIRAADSTRRWTPRRPASKAFTTAGCRRRSNRP